MEEKEVKHLNDKKLVSKLRYEENILQVPIKNMCYKNDPPAFITVVGSKGSGKTLLLKSIVQKFTKQRVDNFFGPITVTTGKDKRTTLFECTDDIHQFVDTSKVSDMVIFVINAKIGLECETMEYISLLLAHGLPKVAFVVTHVDQNNDKKLFKKIKKQIYNEICDGLKFFYVGSKNGKYDDNEILNITRFISAMKYRPVEWKCTHPHIVVDKQDNFHVYGYVRGGVINKGADVYIPGFSDAVIKSFEVLQDPVHIGDSRLSVKKNAMYAPMIYGTRVDVEGDDKTAQNIHIEQIDHVTLFKGSTTKLSNESKPEICIVSDDEATKVADTCEHANVTAERIIREVEINDFNTLKEMVKSRFRHGAVEEKEYIQKFNKNYEAATKNEKCFTETNKEYTEELKQSNAKNKLRDMAYPGEYIKITLNNNLPAKLDFTKIIIIGICLVAEKEYKAIKGKFKKNKLYHKLLKTNDPQIFSVGWRRFQSIPVYSSDTSGENKMLKYCFKHGYSLINFYGFVVPPGTGFCMYSLKGKYRVLGSGRITDVTGDINLVKKLKLVGYPYKVMGNTAFIKDMFTSDVETLKFKDAKIQSVSGLKGAVKNPVGKNGRFRGAFEGEMLLSDIVVLKCFVSFMIHKIYLPVHDMLNEWNGLGSLKEIREKYGIELKTTHTEEVSSDIEDVEHEEDYELPSDIESKLPLHKRNIQTKSLRIELPISPEEKVSDEHRQDIIILRKEKEALREISEASEMKKKRKYMAELQKEKEEKLRKNIIKSSGKMAKQKRTKKN